MGGKIVFLNTCFTFSIKQNILAEGDICPSQRRASAEALGLLARLGNDISTARMVSYDMRFYAFDLNKLGHYNFHI